MNLNQLLLDYYDQHKRDLPWRKSRDGYAIWVSEIMCQQTQVQTVIPYFNRFMQDFKDIETLARADEEDVLKHWQGLGYYSRARHLQKAARQIVNEYGGVFPSDYAQIRKLAGIGDYTAAAISSMAFDQPLAAIDGNFFRVFTRYWGWKDDISQPATRRKLNEKLQPQLTLRPGDFNQAVMDLGATICLPKAPLCAQCPLKESCAAFKENAVEVYPFNSAKTAVHQLILDVFIIRTAKGYIIEKRPEQGLLAGLYQFPNSADPTLRAALKKQFKNRMKKGKTVDHHFSHQTWRMTAYLIECADWPLAKGQIAASFEEIQTRYPFPTAFSRFFEYLKEEPGLV